MANRRTTLFSLLPKEIIMYLCEWIAGPLEIIGWRSIAPINSTDSCHHHTTGTCGRNVEFPREGCQEVQLQFDLGCHESCPGAQSTGISIGPIYLCFHPGFTWETGAFRGPNGLDGYTGNLRMGWTPAQEQLHHWEVKLCLNDTNEVVIKEANGGPGEFRHSWPQESKNKLLFSMKSFSVAIGGCPEVYSSDLRVSFK